MSDSFGDDPVEQQERPIKMAVPLRPLNQIEHELRAMLCEGTNEGPMPFFDAETGELENAEDYIPIFGRPLTVNEAMDAGGILAEQTVEKYRRAICIARELGEKATLIDYRAACLAENIEPIL